MTRIRIGLLSVLFLFLIAAGYLIAKPAILNERSIRAYFVHHLTDWTGALVAIEGPVRLSYFPRLVLEINKVRMTGIKSLPALREIHAKQVEIRLGLLSLISGTPVVDRVTLVNPKIESSAGGRMTGRYKTPGGESVLLRALAQAPFDQIVVENGVVRVAESETTEEFKDVSAKLDLRYSGAHSARGVFAWRNKKVTFHYQADSPSKEVNTVKLPVAITISGDMLSADIDGVATESEGLRITGNLDLKIPNLPEFAKWMGVLVPDDQKSGTFSASGTFQWAGHRIGFDEGSFAMDGNRALGALALDFGGPRPQIEGTLALQKLNLTQYFNTGAAPPPAPEPKGKSSKAKIVDVDFPLLHHLNLDLRISTTELIAGPIRVDQSALSLTLNSGRLTADIAIFDLCGGNGNGRLEFDATVPESALRATFNMTDVSARSCIEIFTPESHVEGTANVAADLTSKGRTGKEILQSLGGKVSLSMSEGTADIDIAKLVSGLRNGPVSGWGGVRGSATSFQALQGSFFFRHGGAYTNSLKINLGTADLTGEGTIDLAGRTLDLRMLLTDHPEDKKSAEKTKPAPKPADAFAIKGPWSEPSFSRELIKSSARAATPPADVQGAGQ